MNYSTWAKTKEFDQAMLNRSEAEYIETLNVLSSYKINGGFLLFLLMVFPPKIQDLFNELLPFLYCKDALLIDGVLCVAVGLLNFVRVTRRRKRRLEALASGKHWF